MREFATKVECKPGPHFVDIVGTGGDGAHTFNISTASMFVAAAAGAQRGQARQPQRVLASPGSADVLEALGANIMLTPEQVAQCIERDRHRLHVRAEPSSGDEERRRRCARSWACGPSSTSSGPLTNPAGAPNILMGVFHPDLVGIQVRVMQRLGAEHVMVVYGRDGMDEVSLGAATMVGELKNGRDPRIRDPSGGLRHVDDLQSRPQGAECAGVAARWCWRRWRTAKARRARS